jgi:hypothetical protein
MNLLFDYNKTCGYSVTVENLGPTPQRFTVYLKSALFGLAFCISAIIAVQLLVFL